ncbi:MAG: O-antigen ligase family protein, partial [Clostridia bacterium]|nr:O-antigen ligase family protein [Clostridia bacterium]
MNKTVHDRKTVFELIPIIIFSSLVPLIVYNKFSSLSETVSKSSLGLSFSADPFTFYKMALILASAFFALIILSIKIAKRQHKLKFNFIILAVTIYAFLTIVSTIFSQYPKTALFGGPERNEGLLVIISYYIMFIYSINILDSREKIKTVFYSLMVSASIITVIGAIQFFGLDPYKYQFVKKVLNMLPTENFPYEVHTVQGVNTSYSTLSSTNYMAMYLSMITASGFALFASVKTNGSRLAASLLIYVMILNLIGSASGGAYYAVAISLTLLLFLSLPYIKNNVINVFMLSVVVIGLLLITNIFTGNLIAERLNISNLSRELVIGTPEDTSIYINDIVLNENDVYIDTTDKDFRVINTGFSIMVENSSGENIPLTQFDEGENDIPGNFYYFSDESYKSYLIKTDDEFQVFGVKAGAREMLFTMTEDGIMVPGMAGELQKIIPVDRNKFIYENVRTFHGRGYIWSASLPLLKETI